VSGKDVKNGFIAESDSDADEENSSEDEPMTISNSDFENEGK
jgi:hypothetical protein